MQQYKYEKPDNLVEFLENSVARFSDRPLFGTRRADGQYVFSILPPMEKWSMPG